MCQQIRFNSLHLTAFPLNTFFLVRVRCIIIKSFAENFNLKKELVMNELLLPPPLWLDLLKIILEKNVLLLFSRLHLKIKFALERLKWRHERDSCIVFNHDAETDDIYIYLK